MLTAWGWIFGFVLAIWVGSMIGTLLGRLIIWGNEAFFEGFGWILLRLYDGFQWARRQGKRCWHWACSRLHRPRLS